MVIFESCVRVGCGAHPAIIQWLPGFLFPGVNSWDMSLITYSHLFPWLWMSGSVRRLLHTPLRHRDNFTSFTFNSLLSSVHLFQLQIWMSSDVCFSSCCACYVFIDHIILRYFISLKVSSVKCLWALILCNFHSSILFIQMFSSAPAMKSLTRKGQTKSIL